MIVYCKINIKKTLKWGSALSLLAVSQVLNQKSKFSVFTGPVNLMFLSV